MATELVRDLRFLIVDMQELLSSFDPQQHEGEFFGDYEPKSMVNALGTLSSELSNLIELGFFENEPIDKQGETLETMKCICVLMRRSEYDQAPEYVDKLRELISGYHSKLPPKLRDVLEAIEERNSQINSLKESLNIQNRKIQKLLTESEKRDEGLQQIEEAHKAKLAEHSEEHNRAKEQFNTLIANVGDALETATIEELSAEFRMRYEEYKKGRKANSWWLVGASVFVLGAIAIGIIFLLFSKSQLSLGDSIARIAIMSTAIGAAWFCATRYTRHNNIMGDYEYKMVLAISMAGFRKHLEGEDQRWSMRGFLKEILQDPLRKRHDAVHPFMRFLLRDKRSEKDDEGDE